MILADTSVWIDHLRYGDADLERLLDAGSIMTHPLIVAEVALGSLAMRTAVLTELDSLPTLPIVALGEIRVLIERPRLFGCGIGLVDVSLIASCLLKPGTRLWTRDRRLGQVAAELDIGASAVN